MIFNRKILSALIIIIILLGGFFVFKKTDLFTEKVDDSVYYAVFLTNGQVYFGNLKDKTEEDFVLTNVYYLQLENDNQDAQAQLSESKFSLVKMGNEIHGPTDELFINRDNILFYEVLRDDSRVVESIEESKR